MASASTTGSATVRRRASRCTCTRNPRKAKRLHFDVIPRAVDDYYGFVAAFPGQPVEQQLGNPAWHIHGGPPSVPDLPLSFGLLLNLVTVAGTSDPAVLWGYVARSFPGTSSATHPELDQLVHYAIRYARDFVIPGLVRRKPDAREAAALADLDARLAAVGPGADAEAYQSEVYAAGKAAGFEPLRDWFKALYETLLGTANGPRMGSFVALYGLEATRKLIAESLV